MAFLLNHSLYKKDPLTASYDAYIMATRVSEQTDRQGIYPYPDELCRIQFMVEGGGDRS
jgi:hypothetical protein